MNAKLRAAVGVAIVSLPTNLIGQLDRALDAPQPVVDLFTCSFVGDSNLSNLLAVVGKWNAWADEHGIVDYSAFLMIPWRLPDRGVHVGWLGVWSSGAAMGRGEALWLTEGVELQAQFDAVVDCSAKRQFLAIDVSTTDQPPPETSVLGIRNCWVHEGRAVSEVLDAMDRWAGYLGEHGHDASQRLLLRFAGSMLEADFDFKAVEGFGSLESYGEFVDIYSGGGSLEADEIFRPLMDCDNRRLYLMHRVRLAAHREAG